MQQETRFKNKVHDRLDELKPHVWRVKVQQVALRGIPDILLCVRGRFEAWELKVPPNKLKIGSLQEKVLSDIDQAGGGAYEVTPATLDFHIKRLVKIIATEV